MCVLDRETKKTPETAEASLVSSHLGRRPLEPPHLIAAFAPAGRHMGVTTSSCKNWNWSCIQPAQGKSSAHLKQKIRPTRMGGNFLERLKHKTPKALSALSHGVICTPRSIMPCLSECSRTTYACPFIEYPGTVARNKLPLVWGPRVGAAGVDTMPYSSAPSVKTRNSCPAASACVEAR